MKNLCYSIPKKFFQSHAKNLELMDKCHGREYAVVQCDALIDYMITPWTDTIHGGSLLHMFYSCEIILQKMKTVCLNYDLVYFEDDIHYDIKTENNELCLVETKNENQEEILTITLERQRISPFHILLKRLLLIHLEKTLKLKVVKFSSWRSEEWKNFVAKYTPAFVVVPKTSVLFQSYCYATNLTTVHSVSFKNNRIYGFAKPGTGEKEVHEAVTPAVLSTLTNHEEILVPVEFMERLNLECNLEKSNLEQLLVMMHACTKLNLQANKNLLVSSVILSVVLSWDLPLSARAHDLPEEVPEWYSSFWNMLHIAMVQVIPLYNITYTSDFFDGRLAMKVLRIITGKTVVEAIEMLPEEKKHIMSKVFDFFSITCFELVDFPAFEPKESANSQISKFHPILDNKLYDSLFPNRNNNQFYTNQESEQIVYDTTKIDIKNQEIFQDLTHWKSKEKIELSAEELKDNNASIMHRAALERFAQTFNKHEIVYIDEQDIVQHGVITDEIMNLFRVKFEQCKHESYDKIMQQLLIPMLDQWICNIRMLHLSNDKKQHNRNALLKLIGDTLVCVAKSMTCLNHTDAEEAQLLKNARAILECFLLADQRSHEDSVYSILTDPSYIAKLSSVWASSNSKTLAYLASHILEFGKIEKEMQSLQFLDVLIPSFPHTLYPRVINHNMTTTVLQFKPDEWQEEVIEHVNFNMSYSDSPKRSLLVCTPTSAGKTFMLQYLVERLLKLPDKKAKVVYVAPTNALCNQVFAELTCKFKSSTDTIVGMFTSDVRINNMKCRVLVTNPACLEILLLHFSSNEWRTQLNHVVLDEIHKIQDENEGSYWEHILGLIRCPFIGLSASVGNPVHFKNWISSVYENRSVKMEVTIVPKQLDDAESFKPLERVQPLEYSLFVANEEHTDGNLYDIHPLSVIKDSIDPVVIEGIQPMSGRQVLQLINAAAKLFAEDKTFENIVTNPEMFDKYGCLLHKKYLEAKQLIKSALIELSISNPSKLQRLSEELAKDFNEGIKYQQTASRDTHQSVVPLLFKLKEKNLTPCIVFIFNKESIKTTVVSLIEYMLTNGLSLVDEQVTDLPNIDLFQSQSFDLIVTCSPDECEKVKAIVTSILKIESSVPSDTANLVWKLPIVIKENNKLVIFDYKKLVDKLKSHNLKFEFSMNLHNDYSTLLAIAMRFGIGMHYNTLDSTELKDVERLFRMRKLAVCFATGTLAYGISMPCRTTVIADNTVFMDVLNFFQCGGRAGRRGFDALGHVIIVNKEEERICRYLRSKPVDIVGSVGLNTSFILRLLIFYSLTVHNSPSHANIALQDCVNVLNQPFVNFGKSVSKLNNQNVHYVAFAINLLRQQGYIDINGSPICYVPIVQRLFHTEPSNFTCVTFLREGLFEKLMNEPLPSHLRRNKHKKHFQYLKLALVLSYLFEKFEVEESFERRLPELPTAFKDSHKKHVKSVLELYYNYLLGFAESHKQELNDAHMPLSNIVFQNNVKESCAFSHLLEKDAFKTLFTSSFAALSGVKDPKASNITIEYILSNTKHTIVVDHALIPSESYEDSYSALFLDYLYHGEVKLLMKEHGFSSQLEVSKYLTSFKKCVKKLSNNRENKHKNVYKLLGDLERRFTEWFQNSEENQFELFEIIFNDYCRLFEKLPNEFATCKLTINDLQTWCVPNGKSVCLDKLKDMRKKMKTLILQCDNDAVKENAKHLYRILRMLKYKAKRLDFYFERQIIQDFIQRYRFKHVFSLVIVPKISTVLKSKPCTSEIAKEFSQVFPFTRNCTSIFMEVMQAKYNSKNIPAYLKLKTQALNHLIEHVNLLLSLRPRICPFKTFVFDKSDKKKNLNNVSDLLTKFDDIEYSVIAESFKENLNHHETLQWIEDCRILLQALKDCCYTYFRKY